MRHVTRIGIAISSIAVPGSASDTVHLRVGRWHEQSRVTSMKVRGLPLASMGFMGSQIGIPTSDDSRYSCLTPEESKQPRYYFMKLGPGDCPQSDDAADGKIAISGTCASEDFPFTFSMSGHYDAKSFQIQSHVAGEEGGEPVTIDEVVTGEYVGQCRGDETP